MARTRDAPPDTVEHGTPGVPRQLAAAVRLCWSSAPWALVARAAIAATAGAGTWVTALLTKQIVDRLTAPSAAPTRPTGELTLLAVVLGVAGVAVATQGIAGRYLQGILERALRAVVTTRLYAAVNGLAGLAKLEDPRFQDRIQLAMNAGRAGPALCVTGVLTIAQGVLTLAGFAVSLLAIAPGMLVVVGAAMLPTVWVEASLGRGRALLTGRLGHAERREMFYSMLLANPAAAKEIRLFRLSDFFSARLLRELAHINREQHAMERRAFGSQILLAVLGSVTAAGGLVWAIGAAAHGRLTPGDVTLFVAAVAGVQGALSAMVAQYGLMRQSLLLFEHYRSVVSTPPDLPVPAAPAPCPPLRIGIELRDVWFRYGDGQPWILRGVSMTIPAGGCIALVGPNGAGKSTLVKLLCRFYDPVAGSIRWDGVDIRDMDVGQLRARLGVVFQDFMCYDLTAGENIGVGDIDRMADSGAIERASRLAGCHQAIAGLPGGYGTFLSRIFYNNPDDPEAGMTLSGGQWQRIAVARALLRSGRDLLIMDEPSSGLDAEAEHELHVRLRGLRQGRTSALISHRLSTVRDADLIVVLENGVIVESGRHAELMALAGRYATMFRLQARGYHGVADGTDPAAPEQAPVWGDAAPPRERESARNLPGAGVRR